MSSACRRLKLIRSLRHPHRTRPRLQYCFYPYLYLVLHRRIEFEVLYWRNIVTFTASIKPWKFYLSVFHCWRRQQGPCWCKCPSYLAWSLHQFSQSFLVRGGKLREAAVTAAMADAPAVRGGDEDFLWLERACVVIHSRYGYSLRKWKITGHLSAIRSFQEYLVSCSITDDLWIRRFPSPSAVKKLLVFAWIRSEAYLAKSQWGHLSDRSILPRKLRSEDLQYYVNVVVHKLFCGAQTG